MMKKVRVALVGGGIAGVALAANLFKQPHLEVCLYEAAPQFSEIGAGISFGANAVRAIELLGLASQYTAIADQVSAPFQDVWFQWRNGYNDDYLSSSISPQVGQSSVHRADFLDAILGNIPQHQCKFNKKLKSIQEYDTHIELSFEDGTRAEADYVIGADGIHSATRDYVLQTHQFAPVRPNFTGTWAYRGIIKATEFRQAIVAAGLDVEIADVPQMFLGKNKHILTFPIRQGEDINIVAFKTNAEQLTLAEHTPWTRAVDKQEMLDDFQDWSESCRILLGLIERPTLWALHELAELPTYQSHSGRVVLMGDAAHAMLPHQGAGAGQGLEDALTLKVLFEHTELTVEDLPRVSAIYEQIRKERACKVQRTSRESGQIYELNSALYPSFEAVGAHLQNRFDWLWQHDLAQDMLAARAALSPVATI
ncbi:salicylate 1-monooxygenase [Acinetobacter soli]|uniref:salicylate 1-monooxygenase n=1 Tax=Acinetobacter soli TaxID=487316 RepID=UPI003A87BA6B